MGNEAAETRHFALCQGTFRIGKVFARAFVFTDCESGERLVERRKNAVFPVLAGPRGGGLEQAEHRRRGGNARSGPRRAAGNSRRRILRPDASPFPDGPPGFATAETSVDFGKGFLHGTDGIFQFPDGLGNFDDGGFGKSRIPLHARFGAQPSGNPRACDPRNGLVYGGGQGFRDEAFARRPGFGRGPFARTRDAPGETRILGGL